MRALIGFVAACWTAPVPPAAAIDSPVRPATEVVVDQAPGAFNISIDGKHVYWIGGEEDGPQGVWRAPKQPGMGKPVRLATTANATGLTLDADRLWWGDGEAVRWVHTAGGEVQTLLPNLATHVHDITRDRDEVIVSTTDVANRRNSRLTRYAITNGNVRASLTVDGDGAIVLGTPHGVYAATDRGLYHLRQDNSVDVVTSDNIDTLAFGKEALWFGVSGEIHRVGATGPEAKISRSVGEISDIAVDDRWVYWGSSRLDPPNAAIYRAPRAGGKAHVLVHVEGRPGAVIVDGDYLYWADKEQGLILRRRREPI